MEPASSLLLVAIAGGSAFAYSKKIKRDKLMQKYGDEHIVSKILKHQFWEGQTQEQLVDALGNPTEIDRKNLKSKSREIWKYGRTGKNRFNLRITVENKIVVGWEQKNN